MSKIVRTTDFVGKYSISQNSFGVADLQAFIDKYEKKYITDLLGVTLGDLFYADIVTPFTAPSTQIYATLFNLISLDEPNEVRSNGIKEMLVGFMYWEYIKSQPIFNTPTGNVIAQNEVSAPAHLGATNLYENYNESNTTYRSIQIYVNDNIDLYLDFLGKMKTYTSQFI